MIKRSITYDGFDGPVTEDHYFHLTKRRLLEANDGGVLLKKIQDIADPTVSAEKTLQLLSEIIELGWGRRDPDNPSKFVQEPAEQRAFGDSLAYDALLGDFFKNDGADVAEFIIGMMPSDLMNHPEMKKALAAEGIETISGVSSSVVAVDEVAEFSVPSTQLPSAIPNGEVPIDQMVENERSGLQLPRDPATGQLWPWWHREPTQQERRKMHPNQLRDVFQRKASDWEPFEINEV